MMNFPSLSDAWLHLKSFCLHLKSKGCISAIFHSLSFHSAPHSPPSKVWNSYKPLPEPWDRSKF